jgi:hypothetical protein
LKSIFIEINIYRNKNELYFNVYGDPIINMTGDIMVLNNDVISIIISMSQKKERFVLNLVNSQWKNIEIYKNNNNNNNNN